ncbi:MAG: Rieske 2Fe-2S domain-containing protein [Woeseiaceae bacterium]|nr:Rieske 2Fe-2S domain-containing protein [Woeseiaceae bacterium]
MNTEVRPYWQNHPATRELLAANLQALTAPMTSSRGLPNIAYNDPRIFDVERERVLGNTWAAIGYGSELPDPGFVMPVDFMGIPLMMVRGRDCGLKVFHNVCSHRGMKLVSEAQRLRTVIRCPYHSWSYDFDGQLKGTPLIGGAGRNTCEGFDKSEHGLRPVRFALWMDIVFVNLSGRACDFDDFIAPLETRWSEYLGARDSSNVRPGDTGGCLELDVTCNWKLAVENYCEAYHLPWVHPGLNSYSPLDQHFNILEGDSMSGQGTYHYEPASIAGIRMPLIDGWPSDRLNHAEYLALYPNTLLGVQADHVFSVIVAPQRPDRSVEKLQILYAGDAATADRYAACRESVRDRWETVFREDVCAVEGLQAGRNSPGFGGGILTPVQDAPTHHFHRWVASSYATAIDSVC